MLPFDVGVDFFPRRPAAAVLETAVVPDVRRVEGAREDVVGADVPGRPRRRAGRQGGGIVAPEIAQVDVAVLEPHAAHVEPRDLVEPVKVVGKRRFDVVVLDFLLQDGALERLEQRRLVVAQLGLDPVLRVEKHFPVGFPDPVVLEPLPIVVVNHPRRHARLEVHQRALEERLHGAGRLPDARGEHARVHLHVDQEVLEQLVPVRDAELAHPREQTGDQGVAAFGAERIVERGGHLQPPLLVVACLHRLDDRRRGVRVRSGAGPRLERGGRDADAALHHHRARQADDERLGGRIRGGPQGRHRIERQAARPGQRLERPAVPAGGQHQPLHRFRHGAGPEHVEQVGVRPRELLAQRVEAGQLAPAAEERRAVARVRRIHRQRVEIEEGRLGGQPFELRVVDAETGDDERGLVKPTIAVLDRRERREPSNRIEVRRGNGRLRRRTGTELQRERRRSALVAVLERDLDQAVRIERNRLRRVLDELGGGRMIEHHSLRPALFDDEADGAVRAQVEGVRRLAAPEQISRPPDAEIAGGDSGGGRRAGPRERQFRIRPRHRRLATQFVVGEIGAGQAAAEHGEEIAQQRLPGRLPRSQDRVDQPGGGRDAQAQRVAQGLDDRAAQLPHPQQRQQMFEDELDVRAPLRVRRRRRALRGGRRAEKASRGGRRVGKEPGQVPIEELAPLVVAQRGQRRSWIERLEGAIQERRVHHQRQLLAQRVAGHLGRLRRLRKRVGEAAADVGQDGLHLRRQRTRVAPRLPFVAEEIRQALRREVRRLHVADDRDEAPRRGRVGRTERIGLGRRQAQKQIDRRKTQLQGTGEHDHAMNRRQARHVEPRLGTAPRLQRPDQRQLLTGDPQPREQRRRRRVQVAAGFLELQAIGAQLEGTRVLRAPGHGPGREEAIVLVVLPRRVERPPQHEQLGERPVERLRQVLRDRELLERGHVEIDGRQREQRAIEIGERQSGAPLQPDQPQHPRQPGLVEPDDAHGIGVAVGARRIELQPVVGVDESRADQLDEILECDAGRGEEGRQMRERLHIANGAVLCLGESEVPPRLLRWTGHHRELLRRHPERLGDERFVRRLVTPQRAHQFETGDAEVRQVGAREGERLVIRQRERVYRLPQLFVRRARQVLRHGPQHVRRCLAGVEGGAGARDPRLQQFVHQIDVGKRGVRVLAGQREVREIGAAPEQHVERLVASELLLDRRHDFGRGLLVAQPGAQLLEPIRRGHVQIAQQIDEVRGGAVDRAAMLTFAEAGRALEQRAHVRDHLDRRRTEYERCGLRRLEEPDRGHLGPRRRLLRLRMDAGRLGPAAHGFVEEVDELPRRHRRDLHRRTDPHADQRRHFLGAVGHAAHPLDRFDFFDCRLGVGLGQSLEQPRLLGHAPAHRAVTKVVALGSREQGAGRAADFLAGHQFLFDERVRKRLFERVENLFGTRLDARLRLFDRLGGLLAARLERLDEVAPIVEREAGQVGGIGPAPLAPQFLHALEQRGVVAEERPQVHRQLHLPHQVIVHAFCGAVRPAERLPEFAEASRPGSIPAQHAGERITREVGARDDFAEPRAERAGLRGQRAIDDPLRQLIHHRREIRQPAAVDNAVGDRLHDGGVDLVGGDVEQSLRRDRQALAPHRVEQRRRQTGLGLEPARPLVERQPIGIDVEPLRDLLDYRFVGAVERCHPGHESLADIAREDGEFGRSGQHSRQADVDARAQPRREDGRRLPDQRAIGSDHPDRQGRVGRSQRLRRVDEGQAVGAIGPDRAFRDEAFIEPAVAKRRQYRLHDGTAGRTPLDLARDLVPDARTPAGEVGLVDRQEIGRAHRSRVRSSALPPACGATVVRRLKLKGGSLKGSVPQRT